MGVSPLVIDKTVLCLQANTSRSCSLVFSIPDVIANFQQSTCRTVSDIRIDWVTRYRIARKQWSLAIAVFCNLRGQKKLLNQLDLARAPGLVKPCLGGAIETQKGEPAFARHSLGPDNPRREQQILALMSERLSNKEIANSLHISPVTVKRHAANIYQKLGVHGRRQAVAKATGLGMLAFIG